MNSWILTRARFSEDISISISDEMLTLPGSSRISIEMHFGASHEDLNMHRFAVEAQLPACECWKVVCVFLEEYELIADGYTKIVDEEFKKLTGLQSDTVAFIRQEYEVFSVKRLLLGHGFKAVLESAIRRVEADIIGSSIAVAVPSKGVRL